MAEEILLDYKINRPNVSTERQETDLKVLLKINASNALRAGGGEVELSSSQVRPNAQLRPRQLNWKSSACWDRSCRRSCTRATC